MLTRLVACWLVRSRTAAHLGVLTETSEEITYCEPNCILDSPFHLLREQLLEIQISSHFLYCLVCYTCQERTFLLDS